MQTHYKSAYNLSTSLLKSYNIVLCEEKRVNRSFTQKCDIQPYSSPGLFMRVYNRSGKSDSWTYSFESNLLN